MSERIPIQQDLSRQVKWAVIAGMAGVSFCVIGAVFDREQFFPSYLFALLFWTGLTLGCFPLLMIHHLAGGRWGFVIRRFLESALMTLPVLLLLFVPLFFGLRRVYPWAQAAAVEKSEILAHKISYLNPFSYGLRLVIYFLIWFGLAYLLNRWSQQQDEEIDPGPTRRLRALSGPGLVIYGLTVSFASIDWVMSLEAEWYSTVFPAVVAIGQTLVALAFATVLLVYFRRTPLLASTLTKAHFHLLGNMLLTFVMMWCYLAFSQLLIIYAGNLPHEISWYLHRIAGGWIWVVAGLAVFNFGIPFLVLLSRDLKENGRPMGIIAGLLFGANIINVYWQIAPSFHPKGFSVHWLDLAAFVGVGGIWSACYLSVLQGKRWLPLNDPRFALPQ